MPIVRSISCAAHLLVFAAACHRTDVPLPTLAYSTVGDTTDLVARGEYLVRDVAVCGHCHAATSDGELSGGREFRNWRIGTARAANLTPDPATGLGAWSEPEIMRAIRNGESRNGRLLAPVMPYEWLHDLSDRDALAIARYLKSLPPVRHEVRSSPSIAFRFARLFLLGPERATSIITPPTGATVEYGRYLSHVALCADCHTPRSGLQSSPDRSRLFAGDAHPPKGFPANPRNLTPDSATGIGGWRDEQFVQTLRTGVNPLGDSLHPFMPWREYRRMTDDDLLAIFHYLQTVPPIRNEVPRRLTTAP